MRSKCEKGKMEEHSSLRFLSWEQLQEIQQTGVLTGVYNGFGVYNGTNLMYPYILVSLCLSGSCRFAYDLKEIRATKNDLFLLFSGHMLTPLEYSDDYSQAWLIFDPAKFRDSILKFDTKDLDFFDQSPRCHLTDEQAKALMSTLTLTEYIVSRSEEELPGKHHLVELQLTLAYRLYLSIRSRRDMKQEKWQKNHLYLQFCDLVVRHYKDERNVNYYAEQLGYGARYFSKVFKEISNGISPMDWIGEYVTSQAKQLIESNPKQTVKEIAYQLGFPSTASFCRYFKRVTGIYPQEYKNSKTN